MKLNVGCGFDYRDGFINIDGNDTLPKVDVVIDLSRHSLLEHFAEGTVEHILANDFIEHHFHWHAIKILHDFFKLLKPGGTLEMRLPDFERITSFWTWRSLFLSSQRKIILLFGGQDIPQGKDDISARRKFPEFFCHKYAYTKKTMRLELESVGFVNLKTKSKGTNFVVLAQKP